jgi:flagellar biosynthetic protein FliS
MNGTRQGAGVAGAYRNVEGIGGAPEDFMKMALDTARNMLLRAELAIAAADRTEKAQALSSAANVVEFMLGLSGIAPGALSECLTSVYQYVLAAILKGNAGDDQEAVAAARAALDELASTWRTIFPDAAAWEEPEAGAALNRRQDNA